MLGRKWGPWSIERKKKFGESKLGTKASQETKDKMSKIHKGIHLGEKSPNWGKKASEETLDKLRNFQKSRWDKLKKSKRYNSVTQKNKRHKTALKCWETRKLKNNDNNRNIN